MDKWTDAEKQILIDNPDKSIEELSVLLNRTFYSITQQRRSLGIKTKKHRSKQKFWTTEEIKFLIDNQDKSDEELCKLMNRSIMSIKGGRERYILTSRVKRRKTKHQALEDAQELIKYVNAWNIVVANEDCFTRSNEFWYNK